MLKNIFIWNVKNILKMFWNANLKCIEGMSNLFSNTKPDKCQRMRMGLLRNNKIVAFLWLVQEHATSSLLQMYFTPVLAFKFILAQDGFPFPLRKLTILVVPVILKFISPEKS